MGEWSGWDLRVCSLSQSQPPTTSGNLEIWRSRNIGSNKIKNDTSQNDVIFNGTKLGCFRPTTVHELRKILKESGIKTSFNDILPANILKQVIEELLPHLCELVNKSLKTGSVEGIKESIVVPLLKKNGLDPDVLKNYRPVAKI